MLLHKKTAAGFSLRRFLTYLRQTKPCTTVLLHAAAAVDGDGFSVIIDVDGAVVGDGAVDNALGNVVFYLLLDDSAQRTRAVLYVVAFFDDIVHGGVADVEFDIALRQRLFEFAYENTGNLFDLVGFERMEETDDVYTVEEFGFEMTF